MSWFGPPSDRVFMPCFRYIKGLVAKAMTRTQDRRSQRKAFFDIVVNGEMQDDPGKKNMKCSEQQRELENDAHTMHTTSTSLCTISHTNYP